MTPSTPAPGALDVLCVGGAAVDLDLRLDHETLLGTSNLATASEGFGGVARNVAVLLARFEVRTALLTAVGDDPAGSALLADTAAAGVDTRYAVVAPGGTTARYVAVLDAAGELIIGANAMRVTEALTPEIVAAAEYGRPRWIFAECNLSADALRAVMQRHRDDPRMRLAIDTISVPKAARLPAELDAIDLLFCNVDEANAVVGRTEERTRAGADRLASALVDRGIGSVVVTLGDGGHVAHTAGTSWWSAAVAARVVDVTGAGDALIAVTLAGILRGLDLPAAAREGALAAAMTTESPRIAPANLDSTLLRDEHARLSTTAWEGPRP